jgi:hypothetical protein
MGILAARGVLLQTTFFEWSGTASAADAGQAYGVVKRDRGCEDVFITLSDTRMENGEWVSLRAAYTLNGQTP